jgi:predicted nuclease of predicted toxin-antitoxin system
VKFKLDENLPELAAGTMRELGHDVHAVADEALNGADDSVVLRAAVAEDRVLVTLDLDFADVRSYPPGTHAGIWVLRPTVQTFRAIVALIEAGFRLSALERTHGQLWVIDEQRGPHPRCLTPVGRAPARPTRKRHGQPCAEPGLSADQSVTLDTTRQHVERLLAELDAHDRADVIARVLGGHTSRH